MNKSISAMRFRLSIALLVLGTILLAGGGVAFAAIYTIDTDDGSIDEWSNQGIPVFQTDPIGDAVNGGTANDDIVQAWVATGNGGNTLYFLMEFAAAPALNANANRVAVASIDCDNDGVDQEPEDRLIVYYPEKDWLLISQGDQSFYKFGQANQGQRAVPPNDKFIEWSVDLSQLPPDSQTPGVNCRNQVGIRFGSGDSGSNPTTVLDETTPLRGWNIPTAINIKHMQARRNVALIAALLVALLGAAVIGGAAYALQKARRS